jgi:hypothetical protein
MESTLAVRLLAPLALAAAVLGPPRSFAADSVTKWATSFGEEVHL